MTREEAIKILSTRDAHGVLCGYTSGVTEALDMAIEALTQPFDEMQLLSDGTLKVKVANVLDIKRVMVMDDNIIYDSYYPDRPRGEWERLIEYLPESNECLINFDGYKCSVCCGKVWVGDFEFWDYCPNCGAIMENKD